MDFKDNDNANNNALPKMDFTKNMYTAPNLPNIPKVTSQYDNQDKELIFEVLEKDDLLATVYADLERGIVAVKQFTDDAIIRPFLSEDVTIPDIMDFFEERCFPRTRANCDQLLADLA